MGNILRKGNVYVRGVQAGQIMETDEGYSFIYDEGYLSRGGSAVSLTLPADKKEYSSPTLFSFFDGLIPEGWLLDVASRNWKIDPADRFGLLLAVCRDPIGNVSIRRAEDE